MRKGRTPALYGFFYVLGYAFGLVIHGSRAVINAIRRALGAKEDAHG